MFKVLWLLTVCAGVGEYFVPYSSTVVMAFIPALIGGIAGLGGSLVGGLMNQSSQASANQANRELASYNAQQMRNNLQNQRNFERDMSNTAYQRATTDMRSAGINPIMAYSQGGASTPSVGAGAPGTGPGMQSEEAGETVKAMARSAMEALSFEKEMKQKDADINLTKVTEAVKEKEKEILETDAKVVKANEPARKAEAKLREEQAKWDKGAINYDNVSKRVIEGIGGAASGFNLWNFLRRPSPPTMPPRGQGGGKKRPAPTAKSIERQGRNFPYNWHPKD